MKRQRNGFQRNKTRIEKHRMTIAIDLDVFRFFAHVAATRNSSLGKVLNKALRKRAIQIQYDARSRAETLFPPTREVKDNEQRQPTTNN